MCRRYVEVYKVVNDSEYEDEDFDFEVNPALAHKFNKFIDQVGGVERSNRRMKKHFRDTFERNYR